MALILHSFFLSKSMHLSGREWDRTAVPGRTLVTSKPQGTRVWSTGNDLPWALGTLLAAWQGWGPKVERESQNSCVLVLSCVCQGRLPWLCEKLGFFASLTLERGDELIKPLGNWTSVTFTQPMWTSVSTFFISWSLKLPGAGEHIWSAAQRYNFRVLPMEHPKSSLSMVSSCCPTLTCAYQV